MPELLTALRSGEAAAQRTAPPLILLVEDDEGDALLFAELLEDASPGALLRRVARAGDVRDEPLHDVDCVVLDLGLPDAHGIDAVRMVGETIGDLPVVVMTGDGDAARGVLALGEGAQDYLVKGRVEPDALRRTLAYAIQRKRADVTERRLRIAETQARENVRLERGLLPRPVIADPRVHVHTRSRPGGSSSFVGGDFYDAIETADGEIHALIGDVCGHGPDEAALGVALRVAWRTLILAGHPQEEALHGVDEVLEHERRDPDLFVTAASVAIPADLAVVSVCLAGHPAPLVLSAAGAHELAVRPSPALGLVPGGDIPPQQVPLASGSALLLYTDGLIEGRIGSGPERLGPEGLVALLSRRLANGERGGALVDAAIDDAEARNGGPLSDDVAALILELDGS
ncbi:MAG: SpoIIE family protein phosphatase [Solirubrobacteraceae bacterium]|nr:SpoIIE family protein phosphatase [Solirubrobacteraceae bacterium]